MVSQQQFRLKWNNHRNTVLQEFGNLLSKNFFVDCIVGAEGKYLNAHKIVLSACSPYFQNIFSEHFDKHPVILLKDVLFSELKCLLDYMYNGEVNISECDLPSFLRTAQSLKIKGLAEDISDYDSASDSEQPPASSYSENGRTVEANVEIHDDDGPPAAKKSSAPYLPSSTTKTVNDSIAGRKRKSPSSPVPSQGKSNISQARVSVVSSAAAIAPAKPNEVSKAVTETETSSQCSAAREEVASDDGDSCRKAPSLSDHREPSKKAEVKEEPVDTEVDNDDNSSYECGNNAGEENDPLNEDLESNCANSGNKFNELSIASVSSFSENDTNDDVAQVKEEMLSEVIMLPADDCDHKLQVHSPSELLSMVDEFTNVGDEEDSIIVEVNSLGDEDSCNETFAEVQQQQQQQAQQQLPAKPQPVIDKPPPASAPTSSSLVIVDEQGHHHSRNSFLRPAMAKAQPSSLPMETIVISAARRQRPRKRGKPGAVTVTPTGGQQTFRKILPASLKPPTSIMPLPVATSTVAPTNVKFTVTSKVLSGCPQDCLSSSGAVTTPYHVIKVSSDLPTATQVLCPSADGGATIDGLGSVVLNNATASSATDISRLNVADLTQPQNIFVLNPATSRVMLLNSTDVTASDAVPTFSLRRPRASQQSDLTRRKGSNPFHSPNAINLAPPSGINDLSAVIRHTASAKGAKNMTKILPMTKFRKIAPQPSSTSSQ